MIAAAAAPLPEPLYTLPSDTMIIIGVVAFFVVAGIGLFLKRAITFHLIGRFASPEAAIRSGWMFFLFFLLFGLTMIICIIGDLWFYLPFSLTMAGLTVLCLIIFLVFFFGAKSWRR